MRKSVLLILVLGISLKLFSQMQIPALTFVFESKNAFTEQFMDKQNPKVLQLTVEGINNSVDKQALIHTVTQMRGVESFDIEDSGNNQYIAKIKVYRYATGWWYWETFMKNSGVRKFSIEGQIYSPESIKNIE